MGGARDLLFASAVLPIALVVYLLRPAPLFRVAQLGLLASILGTIWSLNLLLISLLKPRRREGALNARFATAFLFLALELAASYGLHRILTGEGPVFWAIAVFH
jgi:hypothetical protein